MLMRYVAAHKNLDHYGHALTTLMREAFSLVPLPYLYSTGNSY